MGAGEEPLPIKKISPMDVAPEEPTVLEKFLGVSTGPIKVAEAKDPNQKNVFQKIAQLESAKLRKNMRTVLKEKGPGRSLADILSESDTMNFRGVRDNIEIDKKLTELENNPEAQKQIDQYLRRTGLGAPIDRLRNIGKRLNARFVGEIPDQAVWNPWKWAIRDLGI